MPTEIVKGGRPALGVDGQMGYEAENIKEIKKMSSTYNNRVGNHLCTKLRILLLN